MSGILQEERGRDSQYVQAASVPHLEQVRISLGRRLQRTRIGLPVPIWSRSLPALDSPHLGASYWQAERIWPLTDQSSLSWALGLSP
jgi:hypothetical protein